MSFDLIIKNGTVILENEARVVDIAVKDGKIAAIGQDLGDAKDVMDASGLVVSPGMVDAHTHISEPGWMKWVLSVSNASLRPVSIAVSTTTSVTSMTGNSSKARRSWVN